MLGKFLFGEKNEADNKVDKETKVNNDKQIEKAKAKEEKLKKKEDERIINELIIDWQNTFANLKRWNQEFNGYTLSHIKVENYGLSARIYAPWGIDIFELEKYVSIIESGCKCEFIYNIPQHRRFAMAQFVKPEQIKCNEILFEPIKLRPYEFCPGLDITGNPIIFDVNSASQILIAGQTRRGKNISCYISVVSWIYYCKPSEITIYAFQGAKNDLSQFKNCEHVYCYTNKLSEMVEALKHIMEEMNRREHLFAPMISKAEGNDNIFHYNKLHGDKIPYIYVIIDEFIALMPDNTVDKKEIKELKNELLNYLQAIVQYGGSYGVNVMVIHQKPEKLLMPSFLKNMCNIRVCFGFEDETCVQIVLGSGLVKKAHKLPPRKAYYSNNEQNGYLYTPNMKGRIKMFIEPSIKPNHRTLFGDLKKLNSNKSNEIKPNQPNTSSEFEVKTPNQNAGTAPLPPQTKEITNPQQPKKENTNIENIQTSKPNEEFDKVDPNKITIDREKLLRNIKNIPNFVPYNPNNKTSAETVDYTQLNGSQTQKPIKNKKDN